MAQRIERYFWHEKETLLDRENKALQQNETLFLYFQILMSAPAQPAHDVPGMSPEGPLKVLTSGINWGPIQKLII